MEGTAAEKARRRPLIGRAGRELHHLEEVEHAGESPAAPYLAIGGVAFVLIPVFLLMLGAAIAAYYLA